MVRYWECKLALHGIAVGDCVGGGAWAATCCERAACVSTVHGHSSENEISFIYLIQLQRQSILFFCCFYYSLTGVEDWSLRLNEFYLPAIAGCSFLKPPTQPDITSVRCSLADPAIWASPHPTAAKLDLDLSLSQDFCRFLAWLKDGMWWRKKHKSLFTSRAH